MTITKAHFEEYLVDVKGYDEEQVKELVAEMRETGAPVQDYLSQDELWECYDYTH